MVLMCTERDQRHCWACRACQGAMERVNTMVHALTKRVEEVEKAVDQNTENLEKVETRVTDVEKSIKHLKSDEQVKKVADTTKDDVFREISDRENRKTNLIIHKLPEPGATITANKDKKKFDEAQMTSVFQAIKCDINIKEDVKFFYRVGEKTDRAAARPVVVGFRNQGARDTVLQEARQLEHTDFKDIRIIPDLTPRQRREEEDLRKEAASRNDQLTEEEAGNWEWMVVGPRGQRKLLKKSKQEQFRPRGTTRNRSEEETNPGPNTRRRRER